MRIQTMERAEGWHIVGNIGVDNGVHRGRVADIVDYDRGILVHGPNHLEHYSSCNQNATITQ